MKKTFQSIKSWVIQHFYPSPDEQGKDLPNLVMLAFCYGIYFLLLVVSIYLPGYITKNQEFKVYVIGWIGAPIIAALAVTGIYNLKKRFFSDGAFFYPLLLAINFIAITSLTFWICLTSQTTQSYSILIARVGLAVILFPLLQVLVLWWAKTHRNILNSRIQEKVYPLIYSILPLILGLFLVVFSGIYASLYADYILPVSKVFIAIVVAWLLYPRNILSFSPGKKISVLIDVIAVLLIIGTCIDMSFHTDIHHQSFYLGPVNQILHGRTLLVDVFSQYGVAVLGFLALIFKTGILPFTYKGFSFLDSLLCVGQMIIIYLILRAVLKSAWYSLVSLLFVIFLGMYATIDVFQEFPSIGPLRFGIGFLLIGAALGGLIFPARRKIFLWLEYGLFGLASIWSFETFVYVAVVFIGLLVYRSLLEGGSFKGIVISFFKKLALAAASFVFFQLLIVGMALARTGQLPNWGLYFNFIFLYSLAGFGELPIDPWSPWFILVAIYFISLMSFLIKWIITRKVDASPEAQVIFCLTLLGVSELTYYLGRSHPNNLFHICTPAIIITAYGVKQITSRAFNIYPSFKHSTTYVFYTTLTLLVLAFSTQFINKFSITGLAFGYSLLQTEGNPQAIQSMVQNWNQTLWDRGSENPEAGEAIVMLNKYAADKSRVMMLLIDSATNEAAVLSNKGQILPLSDPTEDGISQPVSSFILSYPDGLHTGDLIFMAAGPSQLSMPGNNVDLQIKIAFNLCKRFDFEKVETYSGVTVFRLQPVGSISDHTYCDQVKALQPAN